MGKQVSRKSRMKKRFFSVSTYQLLRTSCIYQFKEFFNNSNLHGVHFIGAKNRPFYEKFLWFCFFIASLIITLIMIFLSWDKFQTSPTITGLDTDFYKWNVPFPAITICLRDPTDSERVRNFVISRWGSSTANDTEKYEYYEGFVTKIASSSYVNVDLLLPYENDTNFVGLNFKEVILNTVIRCEELLANCSWLQRREECCRIFHPVLTDKGFCLTFNSKHYERNTTSVARKTENNTRFVFESDVDLLLKFSVKKFETNPLSIFIHNAVEKVGSDLMPHHVWTRRVNKILFNSEETYTTENAKQLSIKQRRCVFPDEIRLVTDDAYTYGACMTQCRMNKAKLRCGCVPFFQLSDKIDGYVSCDMNGLVCIARHKDEIERSLDCDCELSCVNTVYILAKLEKQYRSTVNSLAVGFISFPLIRYKRDVLLGWVYLFGTCVPFLLVAFGGIAGLFLGFSVLTAIETFYFFTLRACCMVYREQHKLQELQIEYASREKSEGNLDLKPYLGKQELNKGDSKMETPVYLSYLP